MYGPPEVVERCTVYELAPAVAVQVRLICEVDTAVAATPVGAAGNVKPDTWADSAELPEGPTAATT